MIRFDKTQEYKSLLTLVGNNSETRGTLEEMLIGKYYAVLSVVEKHSQKGEKSRSLKEGQVVPSYNHGLGHKLGGTLLNLTSLIVDPATDTIIHRKLQLTESLQRLNDNLEAILNYVIEKHDEIVTGVMTENKYQSKTAKDAISHFLTELLEKQASIVTLKKQIEGLDFTQPVQKESCSATHTRNFWKRMDEQAATSVASSPLTIGRAAVSSVSVGSGCR